MKFFHWPHLHPCTLQHMYAYTSPSDNLTHAFEVQSVEGSGLPQLTMPEQYSQRPAQLAFFMALTPK